MSRVLAQVFERFLELAQPKGRVSLGVCWKLARSPVTLDLHKSTCLNQVRWKEVKEGDQGVHWKVFFPVNR